MMHPLRKLSADGRRLLLAASCAVAAHGVVFVAMEVAAPGLWRPEVHRELVMEQSSITVALQQRVVADAPPTPPSPPSPPSAPAESSRPSPSDPEPVPAPEPPAPDPVPQPMAVPADPERALEPMPEFDPEPEPTSDSDPAADPPASASPASLHQDSLDTALAPSRHTPPAGHSPVPVPVPQRPAPPPPPPPPPSITPTRYVPPSYPEAARQAGMEGAVHLRFTIDRRGRPQDITVERSSGSQMLDQEAIRAARLWRFPRGDAGRETMHRIVFRLE